MLRRTIDLLSRPPEPGDPLEGWVSRRAPLEGRLWKVADGDPVVVAELALVGIEAKSLNPVALVWVLGGVGVPLHLDWSR